MAYEPLLALNTDAYVGALAIKGTGLSLADITREVAVHTADLATMGECLQGSVCLGLVQVNCNKVGGCSGPATDHKDTCSSKATHAPHVRHCHSFSPSTKPAAAHVLA